MKNILSQAKSSNRWLAIGLTALAVLFTACKNSNEPSGPTGKAKYTVIVYANGGENLDYSAENDISEAAEYIKTKENDFSVRMFVYMKYSSQKGFDKQRKYPFEETGKMYTPGGKADEVYFYEVGSECINFTNDKEMQLLSLPDQWIVDNKDAAMYEPDYIASVLKNVAKNAPAENYILVLAGHASGWEPDEDGDYPAPAKVTASAITDAVYDDRAIKAKELHDGIQKSGIAIRAIVFDCCLQNSIEYLSELTDVTTYTLGSGHTTHGGNYAALIKELFAASEGQAGLKKALSNYAEVYAKQHKDDYEQNNHDQVLMNVDFAVVEMAKLPAVWTSLKKIVDYMCANVKDSAKYEIPSRQCYQYYNASAKYDLTDYLSKMTKEGAPYEGDSTYQQLFNGVYYSLEEAIVHHAYALHYASNVPEDKEAPQMSMNINLGAKGRMQDVFEATSAGYSCYDSEGKEWIFSPTGTTWTAGSETNVHYNWQYSYGQSIFDQKTGWTRWIKLNPVMPYGNPPIGDEEDSNE